jgi:hypothetical protein
MEMEVPAVLSVGLAKAQDNQALEVQLHPDGSAAQQVDVLPHLRGASQCLTQLRARQLPARFQIGHRNAKQVSRPFPLALGWLPEVARVCLEMGDPFVRAYDPSARLIRACALRSSSGSGRP